MYIILNDDSNLYFRIDMKQRGKTFPSLCN